ncbi:MAG: Gfo/Idh/MocA family oxidoreductase [Desulfobulbaceae bacterium]|jgi:predicted dehydrogenase|nr:Gfo/Idh/MocA family oxidoreductase [Desulfobulbaceae bacterium]
MKKIKTGVIGVGYLGNFHAQKYRDMDDTELVGVFDTSAARAQEIADLCHTTPFTDYHELIKQVEAVSIVTPTTFHHQVGMDCLRAGLDVMMEKPITVTLQEADELVALAEQKGCILQVGHLERFNPGILAMEHYLKSPIYIQSDRLNRYNPRGNDVDVVLDLMIHDIDIIRSIAKSPLKTINTLGASVVTSSTDVATAQLIFENGCSATVTASRIAKQDLRQITIHQEGGSISVDYTKKDITFTERQPDLDARGYPIEESMHLPFPHQGDAILAELRHFIGCVRDRSKPKVSGEEGRQALAIALEVVQQIRRQRG